MFDLFASPSPRTRRWVTAVFVWLGVWLIAELVVQESVIVDIAIILGLPAAYGTAGWLILSKRPRLPVEERTPWSLLAIGMLVVLRRSNYRFDPRLMAVGFTFFAQGFGDILFFRAGFRVRPS